MKYAKIIASEEPSHPYNCQIWNEQQGSLSYCGSGRFCETLSEAYEYAKKRDACVLEAPPLTDDAVRACAFIDHGTQPGAWEELEDCEAFWRSVTPVELVEAMQLYKDRKENHDHQ